MPKIEAEHSTVEGFDPTKLEISWPSDLTDWERDLAETRINLAQGWWGQYCRDGHSLDLLCAASEWPNVVPFPDALQQAVQNLFRAVLKNLEVKPERLFQAATAWDSHTESELTTAFLSAAGIAPERGKQPLKEWRKTGRAQEAAHRHRMERDRGRSYKELAVADRRDVPKATQRVAAQMGVEPRTAQRLIRDGYGQDVTK